MHRHHRASPHGLDALREECALDGIECAHIKIDPELRPFYRRYCERHGLFSTAGSDSQDPEDVETYFARHGGSAEWLDEFLHRLDTRPPAAV